MSIVSAVLTGGVLGIRHALEADHIAAVMTLVDDDQPAIRSAGVGTSWGLGHSLPIIGLGLGLLFLGIQLPAVFTRWFEALAGLVLIYLGCRVLFEVCALGTERHTHGDRTTHTHLRIGDAALGVSHLHLDRASFLVGILHGIAGTGALVIVLVSAAPGVDTAIAFLAAFTFVSILTMGVVSVLWQRSLATGNAKYLKLGAGAVGVGVGALLLVQQVKPVVVF